MSTPVDGEGHEGPVSGNSTKRPGHELGAARERAGLSTEEMAYRLHLSLEHLEALERDDYTHLPAATFIRGYLRAYAKEVDLDGDELVAEFDTVCGHPEAPELIISRGAEVPAKASASVVAILILVAVVLVGALAWWFQQGRGPGPATDTGQSEPVEQTSLASTGDSDTVTTDDAGVASGDTVEADSSIAAEGAEEIGEPDPGASGSDEGAGTDDLAAIDDNAAGDDLVAADGSEDPDATGSGDEPAAVTTAADTESGLAAADPDDAAGTAEPDTGSPLATSDAGLAVSDAAATGPDHLEIQVDGESWVEVYDSRGRQLVYTLYSGTSPIAVKGWAPFDVFLGNAPAVTVEFGDQTIDPSAFVRSDNTARFLADSEGASRR